MSTAHKPTWTPSAARGTGNGTISSAGYLMGGMCNLTEFDFYRWYQSTILIKRFTISYSFENEVDL